MAATETVGQPEARLAFNDNLVLTWGLRFVATNPRYEMFGSWSKVGLAALRQHRRKDIRNDAKQ